MKEECFKDGQDRYITRGIHARLPPVLQAAFWRMIDLLKNDMEADYLQIFKLEVIGDEEARVQVVSHSQEVPPYERVYYFPVLSGRITIGKVYIIDEGDHAIMCWAEER